MQLVRRPMMLSFLWQAGYLKQFFMQTAMQCDVMHGNLIVVAYANLCIYFWGPPKRGHDCGHNAGSIYRRRENF